MVPWERLGSVFYGGGQPEHLGRPGSLREKINTAISCMQMEYFNHDQTKRRGK